MDEPEQEFAKTLAPGTGSWSTRSLRDVFSRERPDATTSRASPGGVGYPIRTNPVRTPMRVIGRELPVAFCDRGPRACPGRRSGAVIRLPPSKRNSYMTAPDVDVERRLGLRNERSSVRPAGARGPASPQTDWLDKPGTRCSFGQYHDPRRTMGFRRAARESTPIASRPGKGLSHPLATATWRSLPYGSRGRSSNKDSLGTGSVIRPGEVQIMTPGTGIHTASSTTSPIGGKAGCTVLIMIWIVPDRPGAVPPALTISAPFDPDGARGESSVPRRLTRRGRRAES